MRGSDERSGSLFSYVDLGARVRGDHPLRPIREVANAALNDLSSAFTALYTDFGRPSIAPEKLLRAMLLQAFYGIRSERQLMERLEFDLLFRWFVGLGVDDPAWTIRPSRRTVTGCWRERSRPNSWRRFWRNRR
jgi:transposase